MLPLGTPLVLESPFVAMGFLQSPGLCVVGLASFRVGGQLGTRMSDKSMARAVQKISGKPYQWCLQWVQKHRAAIRDAGEGTWSERAVHFYGAKNGEEQHHLDRS